MVVMMPIPSTPSMNLGCSSSAVRKKAATEGAVLAEASQPLLAGCATSVRCPEEQSEEVLNGRRRLRRSPACVIANDKKTNLIMLVKMP